MTTGPGRILVVEDNPDLADNLREILEDAGYAAVWAGSMAAARTSLGRVDVAVVDVGLPDGDGTQLAVEIRQARPLTEVILLTGQATLQSAAKAVRAGASAYLLKPVATEELLLTVERALRQVQLHREKRELERRTHVAEKLAAVGTMTAGLSHEIRNPLNAAGLQLQVLEKRLRRLPEELQPNLLEPMLLVRDEIRRLDQILEDFLQFARPVSFEATQVELGELLRKVTTLFQGDAEQRQVELQLDVADAAAIAGDEGRLRQVVVNLVVNALQATPQGGRVRLRCAREGDGVVVEIEDSGPGIPAAVLPRIFEPFFTTKPSGSGLGLPIVHSIILQHGGTVAVENKPEGGARFSLRFPAPV